jgi:hypothetical protein
MASNSTRPTASKLKIRAVHRNTLIKTAGAAPEPLGMIFISNILLHQRRMR